MDSFEKSILDKAAVFARERMSRVHSSHGRDHVERVMKNCELIMNEEKACDSFIVLLSACLHDIARDDEDRSGGRICHAELGAETAYEFLLSVNLKPDLARHAADSILTHRFRKNRRPASLEAEILFDADKLDSIGATGIGRAFLFSGEIGARLHLDTTGLSAASAYSPDDTAHREYMVKLRHVKERMLTAAGRRIAEERDRFMEQFFERLDMEHKGLA
jgi:uncharacterized protein